MTSKSELTLDDWQDTVASFMRAMLPGLVINTDEEMRCLDKLIEVVQWLGLNKCGQRAFYVWSEVSMTQYKLFANNPSSTGSVKGESLSRREFVEALAMFTKHSASEKDATLVICSPQDVLKESSINRRALREALDLVQNQRKTIILLGRYTAPPELKNCLTVLDFALPTAKDLETDIVQRVLDSWQNDKRVTVEAQWAQPFCRACAGLTGDETRRMLALSVAKHSAFDARAVKLALEEKTRQVKLSSVVECINPDVNFDKVGGLEHVKSWVRENTETLRNPAEAKKYGVKLPSGLLLTGLPGTGKSLTAKALAAEWQIPLLLLDVGRLFGKYVGESEANFRQMTEIAAAQEFCIIFCDEIEKALGGDGLDGGTTLRVKASMLTWLQEKPEGVFVVATANDIRKLNSMPELLRRFAKIFAVDLPDMRARFDILNIHLSTTGHGLPAEQVAAVAKSTVGFSGAELEHVVQTALRAAFKNRQAHPTVEQLISSIPTVIPLSKTMAEPIAELRNWCRSGRASPAGQTIEADDEHSDSARMLNSAIVPV